MGDEEWPDNPALTAPFAARSFVGLWGACRGGMGGYAHWPDAGGVGDQAAQVIDAFNLLAAVNGAWDEADRARKG